MVRLITDTERWTHGDLLLYPSSFVRAKSSCSEGTQLLDRDDQFSTAHQSESIEWRPEKAAMIKPSVPSYLLQTVGTLKRRVDRVSAHL